MNIDQNIVALVALLLGGVELRMAVSSLRREVRQLRATKMDKPVEPTAMVWAQRATRVGLIAAIVMLPLAALDPTIGEVAGTGASVGAAWGPQGAAIGAAVAVAAFLIRGRVRRARRNRKPKV